MVNTESRVIIFFAAKDGEVLSDQIRSVAQSCLTLCDPTNRSMPGLPVHHQLPEFTQTHVHRVSDAIHHRTVQLQLLLHYWSGHRLGLP